ncbi:MAG: hypothetical protein MK080_05325 [Opitutales bacterium]|nr:hypothetical protein [Opitutales bacterium]NRA27595.1 hypothetical protein [Opitutales bacterium]
MRYLALLLVFISGVRANGPLTVYAPRPLVAWITQAVGSDAVILVDTAERSELALAYREGDALEAFEGSVVYLADGLPLENLAEPDRIPIEPRWLGFLLVAVSEVLAEVRPEQADSFFDQAGSIAKELRLGTYQIRRSLRGVETPVLLYPGMSAELSDVLTHLGIEWQTVEDGLKLTLPPIETWESILSPYQSVASALLKLHQGAPDPQ